MEDKKQEHIKSITSLKSDGESYYFNMFQDGGAVVYFCQGIYLLFEVPLYGGEERYSGTYFKNTLSDMIDEALSWT